jgi:hypothetical protein
MKDWVVSFIAAGLIVGLIVLGLWVVDQLKHRN